MLRNNYIFIDRENVAESEFRRIEGKPAHITIIFGAHQKTVPLPVVRMIKDHADRIELLETPVQGKNALDIVLAYEVGRRATLEPGAYFHIISKDGDFRALVLHLKSHKIHCSQSPSLAGIPLFMNRAERTEFIVRHVGSKSSTRPGKKEGLENVIQSAFARSLSDEEVQHLIDRLTQAKVLSIDEKGHVSYLTPA